MAKLIDLSTARFTRLSEKERINVKLLLYRFDMQCAIQETRGKQHFDTPLPLPAARDLPKYGRELAGEDWSQQLQFPERLRYEFPESFWLTLLCIFTKHHAVVRPRDVDVFVNDQAYTYLKNTRSERENWYFRSHSSSFVQSDDYKYKQWEWEKEQSPKRQMDNDHPRKDREPFEDATVLESDAVTMSVTGNRLLLSLNSRTTKDDMLKIWPHVVRCQSLIERGKTRGSKYNEATLDLFNEIADFDRHLRRDRHLKVQDIEKKIGDHLKQTFRKTYGIGSIRKLMARATELGF